MSLGIAIFLIPIVDLLDREGAPVGESREKHVISRALSPIAVRVSGKVTLGLEKIIDFLPALQAFP